MQTAFDNEEVVIKEKSNTRDIIQIVFLLLLLIGMGTGLYWFVNSNREDAPLITLPNNDISNIERQAGVYLSAPSVPGESDTYIYRYQFGSQSSGQVVSDVIATEWLPVNQKEDLLLVNEFGISAPYWYDFANNSLSMAILSDGRHYQDLVISPDQKTLAFSVIERGRDGLTDIAGWSIGLLDLETNEIKIIPEAIRPVWLSSEGSARLAFLKTNGVYIFDFTNDSEKAIITNYSNLSAGDYLAASNKSNRLAMIVDGGSKVAVFLVDSTTRETGVVTENGVKYGSLVFSKDGQRLVLSAGRGTESEILLLSTASLRVENKINLPGKSVDKVKLSYWQE